MKITIIETGRPPEALRGTFSDYPDMFANLVSASDDGFEFDAVALLDGAPLPDPETLDAVLITGSPYGVYDEAPWMAPLMDFIRWGAAAGLPQVGICFGHQAMAQALGGQVIKSPKGWGLGRQAYTLTRRLPWMGTEGADRFALAASHQDQVVVPPPGAEVIATSDFCSYAGLAYSQGPAISLQGHPEFSDAFASALYEYRRGRTLSDQQVDAATRSLSQPGDCDQVGRWIAGFYRGAQSASGLSAK